MTLLYCTSFGGYRVGGERTDLDPNWQFPASVNPLEAGVLLPGRASARRAFVQETNRQLAYMALDVSGLSVSDTWIIGQAFRIEHPRLEDRTRRPPLLTFMDSTGATDSVRVYARGGTLSVRSRGQNGTVLGRADVSLTSRRWYYLETRVFFDGLGGIVEGSVELRLDEVTVVSVSGFDTAFFTSGETRPAQILFAGGEAARVEVTDIYIADGVDATSTQGRPYNTFLGDIGGKRMTPAASGSLSQFLGSDGNTVGNYQLVDDDPEDGGFQGEPPAAVLRREGHRPPPRSLPRSTPEGGGGRGRRHVPPPALTPRRLR